MLYVTGYLRWLIFELHRFYGFLRIGVCLPICGQQFGRQWYISRCAEKGDVRTMFVLDSEYRPHTSAENLGEADHEAQHCRMADVVSKDGVKYPIESDDNVHDHGHVINPRSVKGKDSSEHWVVGVRVA